MVVWLLVWGDQSDPASAQVWHTVSGCRWAALAVPASGKTGFSEMRAEQTGITADRVINTRGAGAVTSARPRS